MPTITLSSAAKVAATGGRTAIVAAGEPLAGVVVRVAEQRQLDPRCEPGAEGLARRARAARSAPCPAAGPAPRSRLVTSCESRPPTVRLTLRISASPLTGVPSSIAGRATSISRQSSASAQRRYLRGRAPERCPVGRRGGRSRGRSPRSRQCSIASIGLEQVDPADQILEARDAEAGHDLPRLLGDVEEEVDDVLGLALEALAQLGILGRDPDRARVQVAGAHHHAARRDQRRGREAHLVGAQERRDDDVAAGLQLPVGLHPDPRAQVVEHERLLGLGEADLPRDAGEQDRRQRRRAGAAVVARDQDVVGVRLRDAGRDRADARPRRRASPRSAPRDSRSAGRRSAASGPRSSRCRGAAAARSGRRRAW